jgi:hypothetical protein
MEYQRCSLDGFGYAMMRDAAVSARSQKEHLIFEGVRGERPAVAEDHRLPGAPVLVVNLRSVFSSDRVHTIFSLAIGCSRETLNSCM